MKIESKQLNPILKKMPEDESLLIFKLIKERSDRYIEAQNFINQLSKLPWYKRLFGLKKYILEYSKSILKKYDF